VGSKAGNICFVFHLLGAELIWFQLGSPDETRHLRQYRGQVTEGHTLKKWTGGNSCVQDRWLLYTSSLCNLSRS